jgi:hypothetical protein
LVVGDWRRGESATDLLPITVYDLGGCEAQGLDSRDPNHAMLPGRTHHYMHHPTQRVILT